MMARQPRFSSAIPKLQRHHVRRFCLLLPSLWLLNACVSPQGIQPQLSPLPADELKLQSQAGFTWPQAQWWQDFHDPQLEQLITQALSSQPDLQAAAARLRRATALAGLSEAQLFPRLDAAATTTRMRFSERGEIPPPFAGSTDNVNDAGLHAQWTLDFFGKNHQQLAAALGLVQVAEAEQQAAALLLSARLAQQYFELARLLHQDSLLSEQSQQLQALIRLQQTRHQAGLEPQDRLIELQAQYAELERDLAGLRGQQTRARHALAALMGSEPQALQTLIPAAAMPPPHVDENTALPVELLARRPDIQAARWRVEAAQHQLAATRTLFYPNIDLRAFIGYSSIGQLTEWLSAPSRQAGLGLAVSLPIFDAGQLRAQYRTQTADTDLAISSYNATLLTALRDVADRLSELSALQQQLGQQRQAVGRAQASLELSQQRYHAGISDQRQVLNDDLRLINRRRLLIDLEAQQRTTRIELIRALGGGYQAETPKQSSS